MIKKKLKIVNYCLLAFIAFTGKTIVTEAAEIPIAGIDLVLSDYYNNEVESNVKIKEILSTINSEFKDIGIARVSNYVNIRSESNENSKILGKLYNYSATTILGLEGDWYNVKSGTVKGYFNPYGRKVYSKRRIGWLG